MRARGAIALGLSAAILTAIVIIAGQGPLGTINLPVLLLVVTVGPFAVLYLALPALSYPVLVTKLPLTRRRFVGVIAVTVPAVVASGIYLSVSTEYPGNTAREAGIFLLILVTLALAILGGIAYLRESRAITVLYHAVLTVWFFSAAFPYLGESP